LIMSVALCVKALAPPPGGWETVQKNIRSFANTYPVPTAYPRSTMEQQKRDLHTAESLSDDPYQITITEEEDYNRISFTSLLYKNRIEPKRYILYNKVPNSCTQQTKYTLCCVFTRIWSNPRRLWNWLSSYVRLSF